MTEAGSFTLSTLESPERSTVTDFAPSAMTLSISFPLTDTVAVLPEIVALSLVPPWSEDTGTVTDGVEEPPPPPLLLPPPLLGSLGMTVPEAIFSPQPKQ